MKNQELLKENPCNNFYKLVTAGCRKIEGRVKHKKTTRVLKVSTPNLDAKSHPHILAQLQKQRATNWAKNGGVGGRQKIEPHGNMTKREYSNSM